MEWVKILELLCWILLLLLLLLLLMLLLLLLLLIVIVTLVYVHWENVDGLISIITMHNYAFHPITLLLYIFIFDTIDKIIGLIISRLKQTWLITSWNSAQHLLLVIIAFLTLD